MKTMTWVAMGLVLPALLPSAACGGSKKKQYTVDATATEYSFTMPDEIKAGLVTFNTANKGGLYHEFALAKLEDGKTVDDVNALIASGAQETPDWITDIGGVPVLSPGHSEKLTRKLDPGTYVFICFIPGPDGAPHVMHGMVKLFTATGDSQAKVPSADGTIVSTDDAFQVPAIKAGTRTLELKNTGSKPHEFTLISLADGKSIADVQAWFEAGGQGDAPATFLGGQQTVQPGESMWLTLDLQKGQSYTLVESEDLRTADFTAS